MFQVILNMDHPLAKQLLNDTKDISKENAAEFASKDAKLKQIIDLALLSNGMLKGEALSNFIKRSVEML